MEIDWSSRAVEGLSVIHDWLSSKYSDSVANRTLDGIYRRVQLLGRFPYSGRIDPYFEKFEKGHRFVVRGNYRIVYLVMDQRIVVTNVFDMRLDPGIYYQAGRGD